MGSIYSKKIIKILRSFTLAIILFTGNLTGLQSQNFLEYKYLVGSENLPSGWEKPEFNDSEWLQGNGSIGYGNGVDSTIIETATSLYIRYQMILKDSICIPLKSLVLFADYDDGFIAYLNGVEILRINIADSVLNTNYLQTAYRSHEAIEYRQTGSERLYNIEGYYIDSVQLAKCALSKTNILAFAVFNDSINGSDMSFNFHYEIYDTSSTNKDISNRRFLARPPNDSTILPYVIIETGEFGVSDSSVIAWMGIINDTLKQFNKQTDNFTDYNGRIRIKLHGTYSLNFPKNSLRIELQDSAGNNNNVSILGLPAENDFILYGPYQDKTLIKNVFTYNLNRKMGYYAPRTRFCELVLNGVDLGLYVLVEKIKRDKNRVNIKKIKSNDNSGSDITGGYILAYNYGLEILYPDPKDITPQQENYILSYLDTCTGLINDITYCNSKKEYKKYIDINSLADYYLINELSVNFDEFERSWYLYKDNAEVDGRLKYGPIWDYDVAWYFYRGQYPEGWWRNFSPILNFQFIKQDTSFIHLLVNKWFNYRNGIFSNEAIFGLIDSLTNAIAPAIERNYQIWPVIQYNEYGMYTGLTYKGWVDEVKSWIEGRLQWIDENIEDLEDPYCYSSIRDITSENNNPETATCYPNPFTDQFNLLISVKSNTTIEIILFDMTGKSIYSSELQVYAGRNNITIHPDANLTNGVYLIKAITNEQIIYLKAIKN